MNFHHIPVMLNEVLASLSPKPGGTYVDGTLGGGGHSYYIARAIAPAGRLIGIDRDAQAIEAAGERLREFDHITILHGNFHDVKALLAAADIHGIDGMLIDLGVSSFQLDEGSRGFSYHQDAPLDMRMDRSQPLTARDIVNTYPKEELRRILTEYGEEKWAARIAEILIEKRAAAPIETTGELVAAIDAAIPHRVRMRGEGHPARQTFQALRIAVNDELSPLARALEDAVDLLDDGGRLVVISFHSLEDRIVKQTFRRLQNPCTCPPRAPICTCGKVPLGRALFGAQKPGEEELFKNPRARSAVLRTFERRKEA